MRRLLASLLMVAVAVPALGVAGAGATVAEPFSPLDEIPVDRTTAVNDAPTPVCDPMNDSDVALEIAWIKHEIARLEAELKANRADVYARSKVTAALQSQIDSAWSRLVQWDRMKAAGAHPELVLGPREEIEAKWIYASRLHANEMKRIRELLAEQRVISAAIDFARLRLAELEAELFESCHDQPAPSLPPALLH